MKEILQAKKMYCGIDISGATLDICYQAEDGTLCFDKCANGPEGFKQIWRLTGKLYHFVMESTGGQLMMINTIAANILIDKYFKSL